MTSTTSVHEQTALVGAPQPFLRLLEFDCDDTDQHLDSIGHIRDGRLTGIIVRRVYDAEFMASVTVRLERHDPPFLKTPFPKKFRSWFYGRNLNLMGTDPKSYFRHAGAFHDQMDELFPAERGINQHLMRVLSRLDGGRRYCAAPGPEVGQNYMLTTFRGHAEGGYIPAHCDNEQSVRPAYEHLSTLVSDHMYSVVLMIGAADDGGELEIFDHRIEPSEASDDQSSNTGANAGKIDLSQLSSAKIPLRPGDMIVVDSGRYLHHVTPIQGPKTRWVACSFMAHSVDRNAVYCWG
ncbi:MAG: 2OG-Fe(II) oxygenase [Fuerstiella sp.]|nr:2OG-Fe(II) oxygenase [Fuerstiella sp.]